MAWSAPPRFTIWPLHTITCAAVGDVVTRSHLADRFANERNFCDVSSHWKAKSKVRRWPSLGLASASWHGWPPHATACQYLAAESCTHCATTCKATAWARLLWANCTEWYLGCEANLETTCATTTGGSGAILVGAMAFTEGSSTDANCKRASARCLARFSASSLASNLSSDLRLRAWAAERSRDLRSSAAALGDLGHLHQV